MSCSKSAKKRERRSFVELSRKIVHFETKRLEYPLTKQSGTLHWKSPLSITALAGQTLRGYNQRCKLPEENAIRWPLSQVQPAPVVHENLVGLVLRIFHKRCGPAILLLAIIEKTLFGMIRHASRETRLICNGYSERAFSAGRDERDDRLVIGAFTASAEICYA